MAATTDAALGYFLDWCDVEYGVEPTNLSVAPTARMQGIAVITGDIDIDEDPHNFTAIVFGEGDVWFAATPVGADAFEGL